MNDISNVWIVLINLGAVISLFCMIWMLSLVKKDAGIVDVFWGPGFLLPAWITALTGNGWTGRKFLLTSLTTVWALRLGIHIYHRSRGKPEDFRYQEFRRRGGEGFWFSSLYNIFLLQAGLLFVISLPLIIGQMMPGPAFITIYDILGVTLWMAGYIFETLGDFQLKRFLADPANKGKTMTGGLWAWTRHPNYFGECLIWWGIFFIALPVNYGFMAILGPLLLTYLLLKVSGVTLLEDSLSRKREGYETYIRKTSPFFPLPPKK